MTSISFKLVEKTLTVEGITNQTTLRLEGVKSVNRGWGRHPSFPNVFVRSYKDRPTKAVFELEEELPEVIILTTCSTRRGVREYTVKAQS